MSEANRQAQILASPLGHDLSEAQAARLAALVDVRDLADGESLIEEGARDDSLHILVRGKLEVVKKTGAGGTASLHVLREGDIAGELSFVDGAEHTVGLHALGATQVLSLKRDDFEGLIGAEPALVYGVMRNIVRTAHGTLHRMNHLFVEMQNYVFKQHGRY